MRVVNSADVRYLNAQSITYSHSRYLSVLTIPYLAEKTLPHPLSQGTPDAGCLSGSGRESSGQSFPHVGGGIGCDAEATALSGG